MRDGKQEPSGGPTRRGVASAGPFRGHKHTMYEGGIRVPSLMEWPGHTTPGSRSDVMCGTVDYFPTVASMLGIQEISRRPRPIDGRSLIPLIDGSVIQRDQPMFFGYRRLYNGIDGQALVDNRHRLIKRAQEDGGLELYDLQNDPAESTNLSSEEPALFAAMVDQMAEREASCRLSRDGADYRF